MRILAFSVLLLGGIATLATAAPAPKPLDLSAKSFRAEPPKPLPRVMPLPLPRPDAGEDESEETEEEADEAERMATAPIPVPSPLRQPNAPGPAISPQPAGPAAAAQGLKPGIFDKADDQAQVAYAALPPRGSDWPRMIPQTPGGETLGAGLATVSADPGAPLRCLPSVVRDALVRVAMRFGPVIVRSTQRVWRPGARRRSMHLQCRAADIRVMNGPAVLGFLRQMPELGGIKRYSNGLIHLDDGPKRSW